MKRCIRSAAAIRRNNLSPSTMVWRPQRPVLSRPRDLAGVRPRFLDPVDVVVISRPSTSGCATTASVSVRPVPNCPAPRAQRLDTDHPVLPSFSGPGTTRCRAGLIFKATANGRLGATVRVQGRQGPMAQSRRFRAFDDQQEICRVRTTKLSFKFSSAMAHRDPIRTFRLGIARIREARSRR